MKAHAHESPQGHKRTWDAMIEAKIFELLKDGNALTARELTNRLIIIAKLNDYPWNKRKIRLVILFLFDRKRITWDAEGKLVVVPSSDITE
jgi:hypothetical protein